MLDLYQNLRLKSRGVFSLFCIKTHDITLGSELDNTARLRSKLELFKDNALNAEQSEASVAGQSKKKKEAAPIGGVQVAAQDYRPSVLDRAVTFLANLIKKWEAKFFAALEQKANTEVEIILPEEEEEELEERFGRRVSRKRSVKNAGIPKPLKESRLPETTARKLYASSKAAEKK